MGGKDIAEQENVQRRPVKMIKGLQHISYEKKAKLPGVFNLYIKKDGYERHNCF